MGTIFGAAGNSDSFYAQGFSSSEQMPEWLRERGLDAYEYQCGQGLRVSDKTASALGEEAKKHGIRLSIHAPYFISLSSPDEEKRGNSIRYILETLRLAKKMGAKRIVVHSGSCGKQSREQALHFAKDTLARAAQQARAEGLDGIFICPETMGKQNQLGTLSEVLELCGMGEEFLPAVDFGHLYARDLGNLDANFIYESVENTLGRDKANIMHCHFSKIEFTRGGEKRHLTLSDEGFGPDFFPIAEIIARKNLSNVVICESAGTQAEDAVLLKSILEGVARK